MRSGEVRISLKGEQTLCKGAGSNMFIFAGHTLLPVAFTQICCRSMKVTTGCKPVSMAVCGMHPILPASSRAWTTPRGEDIPCGL